MNLITKINPFPFYGNWAGHPIADLTSVHAAALAREGRPPVVYLCGDSSLDNKAWVPSNGPGGEELPSPAPTFYQSFLDPGYLKPDVAFHLNSILGTKASVMNTAVEASLLRQRDEKLLAHDEFVRDHIQAEDILIVSLGANDIALSPTLATIRHMLHLAWFTPKTSIEKGTASSLQHFRHMFGTQMHSYISRLVAKQKPRAIIACTIYYPLEAQASTQSSWADTQLKTLGYGWYPGQLQAAIEQIHASATAELIVEGTTVIPCALYEALDGKREEDYVARVEPSVKGGRRMAELLSEKINIGLKESERT